MRARYHGTGSEMRAGDITHSCTRLLTGSARLGSAPPCISFSRSVSFAILTYTNEIVRSPNATGSSRKRRRGYVERRGERLPWKPPWRKIIPFKTRFIFPRARGAMDYTSTARSINHGRTTGPVIVGQCGKCVRVCVN